jgi:carbonic anhydrase/acetyltransferase-like protein (isoleucine patch superfamily)
MVMRQAARRWLGEHFEKVACRMGLCQRIGPSTCLHTASKVEKRLVCFDAAVLMHVHIGSNTRVCLQWLVNRRRRQ